MWGRFFSLVFVVLLSGPAVLQAQTLVGCWPLNGSTNDTSGNSLNGTLVGSPTYTTGQLGQAITLSGTGQYVQIAHNALLNRTGDFTIALWAKRDNAARTEAFVGKSNAATWNYELYTIVGAPGQLFFYADGVSPTTTGSTGAVADTNWHHLAVTRSGTTLTFYIDGIAAGGGTVSGTLTTNTGPFYIGWDAALNPFDGLIDDVALYTGALNSTQIGALMTTGCTPAGGGPITYVRDTGKVPFANVSATTTASFSTLPTSGCGIIVAVGGYHFDGYTITSVTDNQGGTYTAAVTAVGGTDAGGASSRSSLYYRLGIAAPSGTFTVSVDHGQASENYGAVIASEVCGIASSGAVDVTASNGSSSPTAQASVGPTPATSQANAIVFAAVNLESGAANAALTTPSGYTQILLENAGSTFSAHQVSYRILSATGTQSASWTHSTTAQAGWATTIAAFRQLAPAGQGPLLGFQRNYLVR